MTKYGVMVSTSCIYSEDSKLESWPGHQPARLFVIFLKLSRQIMEQYLKIGHDCFILHPIQLIFHIPTIQCHKTSAIDKALLNK
jgi:hypothetical protein